MRVSGYAFRNALFLCGVLNLGSLRSDLKAPLVKELSAKLTEDLCTALSVKPIFQIIKDPA